MSVLSKSLLSTQSQYCRVLDPAWSVTMVEVFVAGL